MVNRFGHPSLFDKRMGDEFAVFTVMKLIFPQYIKKSRFQKVHFCCTLMTNYVHILVFKMSNQKAMLWFPNSIDWATSAASAVHALQAKEKGFHFRKKLTWTWWNTKLFLPCFVAAVVAQSTENLQSFMKSQHFLTKINYMKSYFLAFISTSSTTNHHVCYHTNPFLP